jgi:hypothetical protein
MRATTDSLKAKAAAAAIATAVVALAASGGSFWALTLNHNETLLRDRAGVEEGAR